MAEVDLSGVDIKEHDTHTEYPQWLWTEKSQITNR